MNKIILWTAIIGGLVLLVFGLAKLGTTSSGGIGASLPLAVSDEDHSKGAENPKVTIVEYSDFQCPGCASVYPTVKQIVSEFPNDVKFVYRHFPLTQIHPNAIPAAYAAEAAAKQGEFWAMHDMIFNTQRTWANESDPMTHFESYAESLGLDVEKFKEDVERKEVKDKVARDERSASGLRGTPTFFLNGKQIDNPANYAEFKTLIENAINS